MPGGVLRTLSHLASVSAKGEAGSYMRSLRINVRIVVLLAVLFLVSLMLNIGWSHYAQMSQAEKELLEKSQIMSKQMLAVWDFTDLNQAKIDTDADGSYNFKGIYCVIAGKGINALFTRDTDYIVRYIKPNPRNRADCPDDFETKAIESFEANKSEYYAITAYEGQDVFRYVLPVYMKSSCLSCHGGPAGELDITGHEKEGLALGDFGGAISIIMPIHSYMSGIESNIFYQSIYFFLVILTVIIIIYVAITHLITRPLRQLEHAAEQIESGCLSVDVSGINATGEMRDLALRFQSMAAQLDILYNDLESQVEDRTEQLKKINQILDKQKVALVKANVRLKEENRYKSEFLAMVSHELRTPLTAIIAFTEIWEKSADYANGGEKDAVREVKENGQRLLHMVNNVLDMAKSEAGKNELCIETVDMVDLIYAVDGTLGFLAAKKHIAYRSHVSSDTPLIRADGVKLRRIVENLGSNAIKFTPTGGTVSVEVTYGDQAHNMLIAVKDSGVGIRKEDIPKVFKRFTQAGEASYKQMSGSGLGLAVVKEFAKAHGGYVELESVYGKGSVFKVWIPVEIVEWGEHDENNDCR